MGIKKTSLCKKKKKKKKKKLIFVLFAKRRGKLF